MPSDEVALTHPSQKRTRRTPSEFSRLSMVSITCPTFARPTAFELAAKPPRIFAGWRTRHHSPGSPRAGSWYPSFSLSWSSRRARKSPEQSRQRWGSHRHFTQRVARLAE